MKLDKIVGYIKSDIAQACFKEVLTMIMNDPTEGVIYKFLDLVASIVVINLIWILLTLLGGIFFGWAPATVAMFTVWRARARRENNEKTVKSMWQAYRKNFLNANLIGIMMLAAGSSLVFFGFTLRQWGGIFWFLLLLIFVFSAFVYLVIFALIMPVFVHYDVKFWEYFRYAFMIGISRLFHTIVILAFITFMTWLSLMWLQIPLLLAFSFTSMFMTYFSLALFDRIEQKKEKVNHETHD